MAKRKLPPRTPGRKKPTKELEDLAGSVRLRRNPKALLEEMEKGWDDM